VSLSLPTLSTARLRLRPHRPNDFDACAALWGDPRVTEHIQGRPQTQEEVWARLLRYAGHWAWLGFGYWAVEEGGRFIGELGFADFKRALEPSLDGAPELGWALSPAVWGQGYATEALTAALAWADANLAAAETACIVALQNATSLRVAAKLGYRETARTTYKGEVTLVFRRPRAL
jgi:RimJ/RimL family protein N-acetyltransferase